jgi:hypothetical protein
MSHDENLSSLMVIFAVVLAAMVGSRAMSAQDKYTLKVPNGLAFAEFKGYEGWQAISISQNGELDCCHPGESRDDRRV